MFRGLVLGLGFARLYMKSSRIGRALGLIRGWGFRGLGFRGLGFRFGVCLLLVGSLVLQG